MFPVAPATDLSASTKGNPAAKVIDSVRAKRAIAAFSIMEPITGIFNRVLSTF